VLLLLTESWEECRTHHAVSDMTIPNRIVVYLDTFGTIDIVSDSARGELLGIDNVCCIRAFHQGSDSIRNGLSMLCTCRETND